MKGIKNNDNNHALYVEKYQKHIPCSFDYKIVRAEDKVSKPVLLFKGENKINRFIEGILKEYDYCKNVIKQHFNKNLVMSEEDDKRFKSSNKYCVCNKLFDAGDNKVRDHYHVTEK